MAEVLMDNPLSPAPTLGAHYVKILQNIKDCVSDLKQEFDDSGGYPINDDIHSVHRLCGKLEYLLQSGIKVRTTLLGHKKDYWNYMCDCLSSNKSLSDGIRFVKSISELQTNLGRGRALLRFCLMHQRLADTMQQCSVNLRVTGDWYHPKSIWFDRKLVSELLNALYDLNDLQFDLPPRDCNLDASWPNFARRNFGGPQNWGSRATSMSSLASIPTMETSNTPASSPPAGPEPVAAHPPEEKPSDGEPATRTVEHLEKLLEVADHEKLAVEAKLNQAQKEMNVKVIHLEKEIMAMKTEIIEWEKKVKENEIENDKITAQLQIKNTVASEKEAMLKTRAEEAEKLLVAFKDDFVKSDKPMTANEKFDVMELRGQMVVQKKKNQALELNLKSSELELASKVKVDQKKTELINLLDKKLGQQAQKIDYLLTTAETLVSEKETQSRKLVSASEELIKLSQRYVDNEKITNELRKHNNQLKSMLNNLDGKGKQIAVLAKDKVKSYSEKNKKLQDEVEALKSELDTGKESIGTNIKALESTLTSTCSDILAQVASLVQKENLDDKGQGELTQIQDRLKSLEQAKLDLTGSIEASASREAMGLKSQLETKINEMSKQHDDLSSQVANLKQENDKLKQEAEASQGQGQEGDNGGREVLLEEIKGKDIELERVKTELAAIRALVLGSMGAGTPERTSVDSADGATDLLQSLQNLLSESESIQTTPSPCDDNNDDTQSSEPPGQQVTVLLVENAQLKTFISQGEMEIADLQVKLEQLQHLIEGKSITLDKATIEILEITEAQRQLQSDLSESEMVIQRKDGQISELTERIDEFSKELSKLRESQVAVSEEKNDLQEQFKVAEGKLCEMEDSFVGLMSELTNVKDENQSLVEERNESATEFEELQLEKLNLEETVASIQACLESSEQTFSEMRTCIKQHESEKVKMESELEDLRKIREDSRNEWEGEVNRFHSQKSELNTQLEQSTEELELLKSNVNSSENDLARHLLRISEIEEAFKISTDEKAELLDILKDAEDKLSRFHLEREALERNAKEFNYKFMSGKATLDALVSSNEDAQQSIEEKDREILALLSKLKENEKDTEQIREELEEARNMVKELQLGVMPKVKETGKQPVTDGEKVDESIQSKAVIVPNIQVENVNLRQQIETLLANKDELWRKVVDEKAMIEEHMNCLIEDVESKSRKVDSLEIQYQSLEEELKNMRKESDGKSEAIQTLMDNMELGRVEIEAMRSKVMGLEEIQKNFSESKEQILAMKEEIKKKEKDWSKEKDGLEKEVSAVKFQMSAKEMEHEESMKVLEGKLCDQQGLTSRVGHYEALIDTLELELRQLREEKEHEQDRGVELHRELQKILQENKVLAREMVTTNGLLQEERRSSVSMKKHFDDRTAHLSANEAALSSKVTEFETDNTELKKKVIQVVREKDALWQKITKLEHDQHLRASDKWMEDADANKCLGCSSEFSLVLRKHHCRLCGRIFCHECCNHWVMTPHSSKKERVCTSCLMSHSQLETTSDNGSETTESDFLDTIEIPQKRSTKWSESADVASDAEAELDRPSQITVLSKSSAEAAEGDTVGDLDLDEARLLSMTDDNKSGVNRMIRGNVEMGDTVDRTSSEKTASEQAAASPEQDSSEQASLDQVSIYRVSSDRSSSDRSSSDKGSSDKGSSDRADSDEAYDLITADEVLESMTEPVPDPKLDTRDTITVEQIESGCLLCPPELWIRAGKVYAVPIFIETTGIILHWEFTTKPKGIHFGLTYKENEFVAASHQEELITLCRCDSHKEAVIGNLTARKPGIYTLVFDNSSSRFTSKKIEFSLRIMDVEDVTCS